MSNVDSGIVKIEGGHVHGTLSWRELMLGLVYLALAGVAAWQTVVHTNAANETLDKIDEKKNLGNNGSQALAKFVAQHRVIGFYIASDLQRDFKMPSFKDSANALAEVPHLTELAAEQQNMSWLWSSVLLGLSAVYLALAGFRPRMDPVRSVLFAGTNVSVLFFIVGVTACALRVFTVVPNFFGTTPVLQHQIRSILSVVVELLERGNWFFGGAILLFSIITPMVKSMLTYVASLGASPARNKKIEKFLRMISKWSMADVFVAAVLLACYSLQTGKGTQVIPCLGLYFFAGYCLLSMLVSSLLSKMGASFGEAPTLRGKYGVPALMVVALVLFFLAAIHGLKH